MTLLLQFYFKVQSLQQQQYTSQSAAKTEIDFLIEVKHEVIPLKVKNAYFTKTHWI